MDPTLNALCTTAWKRCHAAMATRGVSPWSDGWLADFAEELAGAAFAAWCRARDKAPTLDELPPGTMVRAFASAAGRKEAERLIGKATEDLEFWAGAYRSMRLDDLGHLGRQVALSNAMPDLVVAKFLLSMAPAA